ncbi:MAG: XRE family transcriptional regulator [Armatimonadota bacterium]|nr:XRE family transcriptional regulator [Armatimonadota bacterium]
MSDNTIGNNIRRLRLARGLTQDEVADRANVSIASLRNYESGRAIPKVNTLMAIARELGAGLNDVVSEPKVLTAVRFRAHKRLNTRDQILVDAANWLEDFVSLEEITEDRAEWRLADLGATSPEAAAGKVRHRLRLTDTEPIRDICGLLESCGVKVFPRPVSSEHFFGLSIGAADGGPAIVVNTWERIPVERWIFTAAHELGHILLHADSFKIDEYDENDEQEDEANRFASYFLMPDNLFDKEWSESVGQPLLDRVLKIKRMLRVSYATVLYRLHEKRYPHVWESFHSQYQRRFGRSLGRRDEPKPLTPEAFKVVEDKASREPKRLDGIDFLEDRLSKLVRNALERELITRDRAAEILRITPEDMIQRIQDWAA